MRSLFWKIFAWFWGGMVVTGLTLLAVVTATTPAPLPQAWREATSASLSVYGAQAVDAYERGGDAALQQSLRLLWRRSHAFLWLYDAEGNPLAPPHGKQGRRFGPPFALGQHGPPYGGPPREGRHGKERRGGAPGEDPPPPPDEDEENPLENVRPDSPAEALKLLTALVENAAKDQTSEDIHSAFNGPMVLVAQGITGPSGRRYAIAGEMMPPSESRTPADPVTQFLWGILVLLMGTLLCLGLTRYITEPIVGLREAAHQLAEGNFEARSGGDRIRRRDELADLSRDFDRMAERIETLVGAQRRLLGDISHELRSPLTRLSVALALARLHETHPEVKSAHERIGNETRRLNEMIGQVLQLARLESGLEDRSIVVQKTLVDMEALVDRIAADAQFEAQEKQRAVRVVQTESCAVYGNESLLHSAVENVVRNAVRHTADDTAVEISLAVLSVGYAVPSLDELEEEEPLPPRECAVITVHDQGEGVPEASLTEIFKPFHRVETARDRDSGGTGLGLAITERAVRLHGGRVTAANAPAGGLIVQITLPLPDFDEDV